MQRTFETALRLYPRDYRDKFASEMSNAFEQAFQDRRTQGALSSVRFVVVELAGLLMPVGGEWMAKLTTDTSVRGRSLPDRLLMRPPGVSWDAHFGPAPTRIPER